MIAKFCLGCGRVVDRSACINGRCPPCARKHDTQRGTPAQRGYGPAHRRERARQVAAFEPGQPCARCGKPIMSTADADLGHTSDRRGYTGLEHARCNRSAGGKTSTKPRTDAAPYATPAPPETPAGSEGSSSEASSSEPRRVP
jgi:hypothetical protein